MVLGCFVVPPATGRNRIPWMLLKAAPFFGGSLSKTKYDSRMLTDDEASGDPRLPESPGRYVFKYKSVPREVRLKGLFLFLYAVGNNDCSLCFKVMFLMFR